MKTKLWAIILVALAVIAAATAAVWVSLNRAAAERAAAEAAASSAEQAAAEKKTAQANADAERDKARAAEALAKSEADRLEAEKLAQETAEIEQETAEKEREIAEAERDKAEADAEAAKALREVEHAKAETARNEAEAQVKAAAAEASKAQAEADRLAAEKLRSERIIAEVKAMELRQIDFAELERSLMEWRQDLEEREKALKPEKTIADLAWVGGDDDMAVGDDGKVQVKRKEPYLAEKDRTLPAGARQLAKTERLANEATDRRTEITRESIVKPLERLYEQAIREDRVIDAAFYRQSLKSLYPDWEYKGEEQGK